MLVRTLTHTSPQPGRDRALRTRLLRVNHPHPRWPTESATVARELDQVLTSFLDGYHAALASDSQTNLASQLETSVPLVQRGFAFEGAGMGLALLDGLTPWAAGRVRRFMRGPGQPHAYMVAVGVGFAIARLPWLRHAALQCAQRFPPGYAGLVLDGYGFHEGFFQPHRTFDRQWRPRSLDGQAGRCFDAGLGRALWFVAAADPGRIGRTIVGFPSERQPDLWSGVGLAAAYAGQAYPDVRTYRSVLAALAIRSGAHQEHFRLGVVYAAQARHRAGTPSAWTEHACHALLGTDAISAARLGREVWSAAAEESARAAAPRDNVSMSGLLTSYGLARLADWPAGIATLALVGRNW